MEASPAAVEEKFNINLNQNLWGLVASFAALGIAERWNLHALFDLSLVTSVAMTLSVLATTASYTWNYCKKKHGA